MQNLTLALVFALVSVSLFAQQPDAVAANRERPRMSRSLNYGNWVGKQVMNPEFMEKVGIHSGQAQKLKEEMEKIDTRLKALDEEIHAAALQQADIAKKVLVEPGKSTEELMKLVERIGTMRTEQAKLSTQILVVIRDNLTEAQRKKAHELITAEGQRRLKERMERREREGQPRLGPDGRRPLPRQRPEAPPRPAVPQGW
jgi:flagellar hook-basal body complex protein FliE